MSMFRSHEGDEHDAETIGLMQRGQSEGIERLLRIYGPRIKGGLRLTFRFPPGDDALEDAVHDAAMILFRKATRLRADGNLGGYFYTTARRELVRGLKRRGNEKQLWEGADEQIADKPADEVAPEVPLAAQVAALIERLPRLEREILAFDRATNFRESAADVARALRTTKGTVYVLRCRTKERLEELIARCPGSTTSQPESA